MSAKLILHKDHYEIEYDDGKIDIVKHDLNKYNFNRLPININLRKTIGNLYIQKNEITKVYLGKDVWCTLDTESYNKIINDGYGKMRIGLKYKTCADIRLNKDKKRYSLSKVLFPLLFRNTAIVHLNCNKYDYRLSNCRRVPRWICYLYYMYKCNKNSFGYIYKDKNNIYLKYQMHYIRIIKPIVRSIKLTREEIIKNTIEPLLIKFGLIKGGL